MDIEIGTTFLSNGKHKRLCTVSDIHKTYNIKNELVKTSYVAFHLFMGQVVYERDICKVTIQRGIIE
jgi:hypothetical protein